MYNLKIFGQTVYNTRKERKLTQQRLYQLSGVHVDTIRKIEKGKVVPTQETLDLLSITLNKDLNKHLLNSRYNYRELKIISERIEYKLDLGEYKELADEIKNLNELMNQTSHQYFLNIATQLFLLTKSMDFWKNHDHTSKALEKLIEGISITIPSFVLCNYKAYPYSSMELRILMNIALILQELNDKKQALNILEFCLEVSEKKEKLYPRLCYNLSYLYYRSARYKKALGLSELAIDTCLRKRDYNGINLMFFIKGMSEYYLGKETYISSLNKSVHFCEISGQISLRDGIVNACKNLNINLD